MSFLGVKQKNGKREMRRYCEAGISLRRPLTSLQNCLKKYRPKKAIEDLINETSEAFGVAPEVICPRSRQRMHSAARSAFPYLAVEESEYLAADVARVLGVKRMSVHEAVVKGRTLCAERALARIERQ